MDNPVSDFLARTGLSVDAASKRLGFPELLNGRRTIRRWLAGQSFPPYLLLAFAYIEREMARKPKGAKP